MPRRAVTLQPGESKLVSYIEAAAGLGIENKSANMAAKLITRGLI